MKNGPVDFFLKNKMLAFIVTILFVIYAFSFLIWSFYSCDYEVLKQLLPLLCSFSKNCFAYHQRKLRSLWCKTNCMFLKSIRVLALTISFFFSTFNRNSRVGGYNNDYSSIYNSRPKLFIKMPTWYLSQKCGFPKIFTNSNS